MTAPAAFEPPDSTIGADVDPDAGAIAAFRGNGDEPAFAGLVHRHGPMVLAVCRRILGDGHDAEDAAQLVFLQLARKVAAIDSRGSVAAWLHHAATCAAIDLRRARAARRAREVVAGNAAATIAEHVRADSGAESEILHHELSRLPDRYRRPLVMYYLEGMPLERVCAACGRPPSTVSRWIAAGREHLRRRLARRGITVAYAAVAGLLISEAGAAGLPVGFVDQAVRTAGSGAAPVAIAPSGLAVASTWVVAVGAIASLLIAGAVAMQAHGNQAMSAAARPPESASANPMPRPDPPAGEPRDQNLSRLLRRRLAAPAYGQRRTHLLDRVDLVALAASPRPLRAMVVRSADANAPALVAGVRVGDELLSLDGVALQYIWGFDRTRRGRTEAQVLRLYRPDEDAVRSLSLPPGRTGLHLAYAFHDEMLGMRARRFAVPWGPDLACAVLAYRAADGDAAETALAHAYAAGASSDDVVPLAVVLAYGEGRYDDVLGFERWVVAHVDLGVRERLLEIVAGANGLVDRCQAAREFGNQAHRGSGDALWASACAAHPRDETLPPIAWPPQANLRELRAGLVNLSGNSAFDGWVAEIASGGQPDFSAPDTSWNIRFGPGMRSGEWSGRVTYRYANPDPAVGGLLIGLVDAHAPASEQEQQEPPNKMAIVTVDTAWHDLLYLSRRDLPGQLSRLPLGQRHAWDEERTVAFRIIERGSTIELHVDGQLAARLRSPDDEQHRSHGLLICLDHIIGRIDEVSVRTSEP